MQPIQRTSVTAQAIEQIKKSLFSGEYQPGDKLSTETELSAALGVGRSTVREAIRTLEAMGYVELRPGRGAFVRITREEDAEAQANHARAWFTQSERTLTEFAQLRRLLEPEAAALAACHASREGKAQLTAALDAFCRAAEKGGEPASLSAADRLFHTTLIRESGNRLLYQFYQQTETLFTAYSVRSFTARPDTPPHTLSEHRRILDAVLAGEGEAAREAMRLHLTIADQRISTIIREEETV